MDGDTFHAIVEAIVENRDSQCVNKKRLYYKTIYEFTIVAYLWDHMRRTEQDLNNSRIRYAFLVSLLLVALPADGK